MTPQPIGKPISAADVKTRLGHAEDNLRAAKLVLLIGRDDGIISPGNIIGSLAVSSGIASADAICGQILQRRGGENHRDAIKLLREAGQDHAAAQLARLLEAKSATQYSATLISDAKADELLRAAERLHTTAEAIVGGTLI